MSSRSSLLCCGLPLRAGVRIVAITDIIVEIITIAFVAFSLATPIGNLQMSQKCAGYCNDAVNNRNTNIAIIALDSCSLLIHIVEFLIIILVYQGAQQASLPKCKIWARITEALTTVDGIIFVAHMIISFDVGMLVFMIFDLTYKSYSVAVVEAYMQEMRSFDPTAQGERQALQ